MSWLWKKWIENSNFLSKVKIFKWKSSTKLIADKSRILSASVAIQDHVCYPECLMLWLTDYCLRVPCAHVQLLFLMKHLFPPKDLSNRGCWAKAEMMSLLWIYLEIFWALLSNWREAGNAFPPLCLFRYSQVTSKEHLCKGRNSPNSRSFTHILRGMN